MNVVGRALRLHRGTRTQAELAAAIGTSTSMICRLERGQRRLTPRIARKLDVLLAAGATFEQIAENRTRVPHARGPVATNDEAEG